MKIKNRPDIFGDQVLMNGNDEIIGREEYLLTPATDIDITSAARIVRERGGAAFPAHIDKQANGLISILGSFPPEPGFACAEFFNAEIIDEYKEKYPPIRRLSILSNSDAHTLDRMPYNPPQFPGLDDSGGDDEIRRLLIERLNGV
jgi:hypothetical protein